MLSRLPRDHSEEHKDSSDLEALQFDSEAQLNLDLGNY